MYNLIKKHKRHLLAVATAFLMVAFLMPAMNRSGSHDQVVATAFGQKVYASQVQQSSRDWQLLKQNILYVVQTYQGPQVTPLAGRLGEAATRIDSHTEMFHLLLLEARKMGVTATDNEVRQVMTNVTARGIDMQDPDAQENVFRVVREFITVVNAFNQVSSAARVSEPLRDYELAMTFQKIKVNAVDFVAQAYADKVPAPTQDQLQNLFNKYKDQNPEMVDVQSTANPFGFGYKYPDRVKLQYIKVPEEEVRKAVVATKTSSQWKVDEWAYFLQHQQSYQTTPSQPGIDPTGLQLGPTRSAPTTRPFDEVEKDVFEAVLKPQILTRRQAVVSRIVSILRDDWNTFHQAKSGENPQTSLGAPYGSYEYLQKLASLVQKQFNVAIVVEQLPEWSSGRDLELRTGIGRAVTNAEVKFPLYAVMTADSRKALQQNTAGLPPVLQLLEPSQEVHDVTGDAYLFRVTARDAAHVPATLAEVATAVERDYKIQQSFDLAKKAADAFIGEAKTQGFSDAADANKFKLRQPDAFARNSRYVPGMNLSDTGNEVFIPACIKTLLAQRAANNMRPVSAIAVPRDGRVIVTELAEVQPVWSPESLPSFELAAGRQAEGPFVSRLMRQWYEYKAVVDRTNYQPKENSKRSENADDQSPQPTGPLDL